MLYCAAYFLRNNLNRTEIKILDNKYCLYVHITTKNMTT